MKTQKIKHYRLGVSITFPARHPRRGKLTYFVEKIQLALSGCNEPVMMYASDMTIVTDIKIHTIRRNLKLWAKRMQKVYAGKAVIDLCYWKLPGGRFTPGNELITFATLDKDSGCGVQKITIEEDLSGCEIEVFMGHLIFGLHNVAKNDGLSLEDFKAWFKGYDLSKPMAIIHFTKFRY